MRLDRTGRAAQQVRDLRDRQVLVEPHHQHGPLAGRQRSQRLPHRRRAVVRVLAVDLLGGVPVARQQRRGSQVLSRPPVDEGHELRVQLLGRPPAHAVTPARRHRRPVTL
jgi:hypothetical protein